MNEGIMEEAHVGLWVAITKKTQPQEIFFMLAFGGRIYTKYCQVKVKKCDIFEWVGHLLRRDEIPLHLVNPCLPFEIWEIDFIDPFPQRAKLMGEKYIITTIEYLTKWAEAEPVESCTKEIEAKFSMKISL
jgi:hypothetical protein